MQQSAIRIDTITLEKFSLDKKTETFQRNTQFKSEFLIKFLFFHMFNSRDWQYQMSRCVAIETLVSAYNLT